MIQLLTVIAVILAYAVIAWLVIFWQVSRYRLAEIKHDRTCRTDVHSCSQGKFHYRPDFFNQIMIGLLWPVALPIGGAAKLIRSASPLDAATKSAERKYEASQRRIIVPGKGENDG